MSNHARFERYSDSEELDEPGRPGTKPVNPTLLTISVVTALAATLVALYIYGHPFIPQDAKFEREVQAINWGPLTITFPVFSFIGDAKGAVLEGFLFLAVLVFNRRAWLLAAGSSLTAGWYVLLSHLILRARPTNAQVLRVTEHPGASSFPSGHTMFIVTIVTVLMLCLGRRFLPRWGQVAGWILACLIVLANGISRMYVGAHWPTDVLAGILIAAAWLCLLVSIRRISDRALST